MIKALDLKNFDESINSGVCVIDFWADWCGPCQKMLPVLEEFDKKMGNKLLVGKVNVDESPELAARFRVMSIPTIIVFKDGNSVDTMVGVQTIEKLEEVVTKNIE